MSCHDKAVMTSANIQKNLVGDILYFKLFMH